MLNRFFLGAVVLVVIVFAFFYLVPLYEKTAELKKQDNRFADALAVAVKTEDRLLDIDEAMTRLTEEDRTALNHILPPYLEELRILNDINTMAAESGVSIIAVNSEKTQKTQRRQQDNENAKPYQYAIVGFKIEADYEPFVRFIKKIEQDIRLFEIIEIRLENKRGVEEEYKEGAGYVFSVKIKTRWMNVN